MNIQLYDTRRRAKVSFVPIEPGAVRMYVCGPTVYDFAHIGNARPAIVFDVLFRLLRLRYGADHVTYVRNITDVDDKIIARAVRDFPELPLNEAISEVTRRTEEQFKDDVAALGCLPPTAQPRATEHIPEMRALIERLVARGFAYVAQEHVLFSPAAMKARHREPAYGALAKRSLDEMLAGARVDVAPYKRDPMDFVLWKPSKIQEPGWPSPCGIASPGRPGWHIECSAMSMAKLLTPYGGGLACDDPNKNVFDIHGGGIDLVFPHHENEVAQSCCAFGSTRMANIFMHNGFLQVEGAKMSKSAGNFITIHELLLKFPGDAVRLNMLRTHYRQPIDWTEKAVVSTIDEIRTWAEWIVGEQGIDATTNLDALGGTVDEYVVDALADDLNTPLAIKRLRELFEKAKSGSAELSAFVATARFMGIEKLNMPGYFDTGFSANLHQSGPQIDTEAEKLIIGFRAATSNGSVSTTSSYMSIATDFKEQIMGRGFKVALNNAGVLLVDNRTGGGTQAAVDLETEFEAEVDKLVAERAAARNRKDWPESDRLRDELMRKGVEIKDGKDGTKWKFKSTGDATR